jgi:dihydropyrimidine dehydrogenase (NAD+) subunit PreA
MAMGAGNVQVCTAAMTYGFKVVQEMISGLSQYLDEKGMALNDLVGRAVPNVVEWQHLNLNYVAKAHIDQDACIKCGRCYAACEDTSHQAIAMSADRVFTVKDEECVACNLCVNVCPVDNCITMVPMAKGTDRPAHRPQGGRLTPTGRPTPTTRWPSAATATTRCRAAVATMLCRATVATTS